MIFLQTVRATIIHVMSSNMHSRCHASFTFILIVTCSFIYVDSSDVISDCLHQVNNKTGCNTTTTDSDIQKVLRNLNSSEGMSLNRQFIGGNNDSLNFTFVSLKGSNSNEVLERKMKMKMTKSNVLALLLIPAMWIAGMMPWVLPGIKMVVMMVTMMNNMAFSSALFSLIRGYLFDTRTEDHIVYLNYGYKNGQQGHHHNIHNNEINYKNNPYLYPHKLISG